MASSFGIMDFCRERSKNKTENAYFSHFYNIIVSKTASQNKWSPSFSVFGIEIDEKLNLDF